MLTTKRTKKITVRFSVAEYDKYLFLFQRVQSSYTQSQFIRDCVFNSVPPEVIIKKASAFKPTACDKERVRQIAGLTNNINQIARNLNRIIKSSNQSTILVYLKKLDTIYNYCNLALYEET